MLSTLAIASAVFAPHTFGWKGTDFLLDGQPFQVRSGEMHYIRIPREYWKDRLQKAKAMGLNTVCTYVFWNAHEAVKGKFDFSGNRDVAAFVREAQRQGLWVIVRPGPYVCSEWEWGGFPWWLAADPAVKVRQDNPAFLSYSERYLKAVGKQLAPLTIGHGGPIIMCQVENEYGSFGKDHVYMGKIRDQIKAAGFDCQLFTSDGAGKDMLNGGTLPDCLSVINFGGGPQGEFAEFAKFRQNVPRMNGEYWAGWFDHWGHEHAQTDADGQVADLDWMMSQGISFNIYMLHGGTTFGLMNGANWVDGAYRPDVTNYDYDAAIDEAGRLTKKWAKFRDVIAKYSPGQTFQAPPAPLPMAEFPKIRLQPTGNLFGKLTKPITASDPKPMEELGCGYGFILYRRKLVDGLHGMLELDNLQDRALVYVDGELQGIADRRLKQHSVAIEAGPNSTLDILVENLGRINFAQPLIHEKKGISGVSVGSRPVLDWEMFTFPCSGPPIAQAGWGPAVMKGTFELASRGDTYLDMRAWGKGMVWVNGKLLGRYWNIGAQQALFCPATFLRRGSNEVTVLELEDASHPVIQGVKDPIWSGM